jgi:hypothetical protein
MDPAIIAGLVVFVLVIVVGVVATVRVPRPRGGALYTADPYPRHRPGHACVMCHRSLAPADQVAGYSEQAIRELLGRVPTAQPVTDPSGRRRWLAHARCAEAAGTDLSTAVPIGGGSPPARSEPARPGDLTCPACGRRFTPPNIMVITEADAAKYGPDPVRCPHCDHIWNAGRDIWRMRGG